MLKLVAIKKNQKNRIYVSKVLTMGIKSIINFSFFILLSNNTAAQTISRVAGLPGSAGYSGDGGISTAAKLNYPWGTAIDNGGNVYIGDSKNFVIRRVNVNGIITTIAGTGISGFFSGHSGDNTQATSVNLGAALSPVVDNAGNIFFLDGYFVNNFNYRVVRKISTTGNISTIAGTNTPGFSGDGGLAVSAQLNLPNDLAINSNGELFISDAGNFRIRKIDNSGIISTVAGTGNNGFSGDGGLAIQADIFPTGIGTDNSGNIFFAQSGNARIREITPAGIINTVAGNGTHAYGGDGGLAVNAQLDMPYDVAVDNVGNIFIADYANHRIRKIDNAGIISTIAGTGVIGTSPDGTIATQARLTYPVSVSADNSGNIYFNDVLNHIASKINGCISTIIPSIIISIASNTFCDGSNVSFISTITSGGNSPFYQWKVNGATTGNTTATFSLNTLKDGDVVTCELKSSINCTQSVTSNSITVTVHPLPIVNAGADLLINPGQSVQINAITNAGIVSYQWVPATGLSNAAVLNPIARPSVTTKYQLKVISTNGCENSDEMKVTVYKKLMMPSAFTPNNDGLNDFFQIPATTTLQLTNFSIYNRYGAIVFKTSNINEGWDGKYKGILLGNGAYVYTVTGDSPVGKVFEKGTVILIK